MQNPADEKLSDSIYRVENAGWRLETYALEHASVDPWQLLSAASPGLATAFWKAPDDEGGAFTIGLGCAKRGASQAGFSSSLSDAREGLDASFEDGARGMRAFFATAFDPSRALGERWSAFSPVEVIVPEMLLRISHNEETTLTILAETGAFADVQQRACALLDAGAAPRERRQLVERFTDDAAYEASVSAALERIARGGTTKIVVARTLDVRNAEPFDAGAIARRLGNRFPNCFVFALCPGGEEQSPVFLGATPERLVAVEDGNVKTGALAGSAPRGASAEKDAEYAEALLASAKERHEHDLVAEMITTSLGPICETTRRGDVAIKKLGNVQHLFTPIEGQLCDDVTGILDAVALLHPTPAVCGEPRAEARTAIGEVENFQRGLYAGAVGWIDLDGRDGDVAVAIRSALIDTCEARLFAGAGIVDGSDPTSEARETRMKFNAVLEAL